jgi:REP element-mobilizing transposase RayT
MIFRDDQDRLDYLVLLELIAAELRWQILAFCLMGNHVHLLVWTEEPNLGRGMQRLHSMFARGFNLRYERIGHLFESRYGSNRIRTALRLVRALDYIAQNPVRAGLCSTPSDWKWSSRSLRAPRWIASPARVQSLVMELAE